jgi:hypothetical protein
VNTLGLAFMNSILLTGYCFILPVVTFIEPQRPAVRYYRTCCFLFFKMHLDMLIFLYLYWTCVSEWVCECVSEWVSEWVGGWVSEWVSEWVRWVSEWVRCQFSNMSATGISWREQVNFQWDDDEVRFVLDQHAEFDFYSASSLKQQSAGKHVAPPGHIILIPSEPILICLLNSACLEEKQQIPIL